MKIKIFTLKFIPEQEEFDTEELDDYISDKEVLSFDKQFFTHNNCPYWSVMISCRDNDSVNKKENEKKRGYKKDFYKTLDDNQKPLYDVLRKWRLARSKKEGMPPYIIFNNRQLTAIVINKPKNITELREINGIGDSKAENYGPDILELVSTFLIQNNKKSEKE